MQTAWTCSAPLWCFHACVTGTKATNAAPWASVVDSHLLLACKAGTACLTGTSKPRAQTRCTAALATAPVAQKCINRVVHSSNAETQQAPHELHIEPAAYTSCSYDSRWMECPASSPFYLVSQVLHNGSILRGAQCTGVQGVILCGQDTAAPLKRKSSRAAAGTKDEKQMTCQRSACARRSSNTPFVLTDSTEHRPANTGDTTRCANPAAEE
jgi:tRNA G18 (ribose-2'-O)-methylase SpoU